ncbi:MAG TPA: 2-phospho-L-lactate transferase [Candidatus Bathyarchaeota archaeon]|nr:2-phospho-L-lactate transferase [Candidatus Bathyarchaeota archaeon]
MIVALAGGVGAARFLQGLVRVVEPGDITAIVNTGDDIELHGLYISPDVDIVLYTLAGIVDEQKGWGIKGDTFYCLEMLGRYGLETWFKLGDKDLATHIYRTMLLRAGYTLSQATEAIRKALGVEVRVIPMSDQPVRTIIITDKGPMHFQEYLVKRGARDAVLGVRFEGVEAAEPAPGVLEAIEGAEGIIICPSNPIVSIGTILALRGVREALREVEAPIVAISPIVGGAPVKGPADKLMRGLGIEVSAYGVASLYKDFLDYIIIDEVDRGLRERIEQELSIRVVVANTLMKTLEDKVRLAKLAVGLIRG